MKKLSQITLVLMLGFITKSFGATGDTIVVQAHQNYVINWNGNYDQWALFPQSGSYSKVIMRYTLSNPQPATQWDYTTNVFALKRTGDIDSTLEQYPYFTYGGQSIDTVYFSTNTNYTNFYNSITMGTDSAPSPQVMIHLFGDAGNPSSPTDSFLVYPANFYNYIYNAGGTITDSILVPYDSLWVIQYYNIYTPFEVIEPFELGRVMTPYGSTLTTNWAFDFWFDVTDYTPLFHDSVEMRVRYDGWSNGYAFSVTFYMIEGTPPRTAQRVRNIYPYNYYEYGITTNPIESHLVPVTMHIQNNESNAMLRVVPSGHSFGGAQNCAEFCIKNFKIVLDGVQQFSKQIWRSDCGLNPILHQGGTWIYDRSNWCPGSKTLYKDQEVTPFITAGDSLIVDMNLDAYTYSGGAGFNPGYILSTQLFTYGNPNFTLDATVEEILKPNNDENYSRFNPICNNPEIVIKNTGSTPLTSLTINYGINGGAVQTYNWTGALNFLETETVYLGNLVWGGSGNDNIFEVTVSNPNGGTDQYPWNDTLRSHVGFTPMYPSQFRLNWKTNNAAFETTYQLQDDQGTILYSSQALSANTLMNDTFDLAPGCYYLKISDSGKDGLAFFANTDGTGYARLMRTDGTSVIIKQFQADFGTSVEHYFTVGFTTGIETISLNEPSLELFPNPAADKVTITYVWPQLSKVDLVIYNLQGKVVYEEEYSMQQQRIDIDTHAFGEGLYIVRLTSAGHQVVKKLVIQ